MSATVSITLGRWSRLLFILLLLSLGLWLSTAVPPSNAAADPFVVNSTGDGADAQVGDGICNDGAGYCTLRAALMEANAGWNKQIHFNIPGAEPHVIQPLSALPLIESAMVIDGYTQPGAQPNTNPAPLGLNTQLMIGLDGSQTGGSIAFGFNPNQESAIDSLVIQGFAIYNFGAAIGGGYEETYDVIGARFVGNFFGTDVTGTLASSGSGIVISGHRLMNIDIGGIYPEDRNLIPGVSISSRYPESIQIQGNLIGTDISGERPLGNGGGIYVSNAYHILIGGVDSGAANVISGNINNGIELEGNDGITTIQGNLIGLAADGQTPLGNGGDGIYAHEHAGVTINDNYIAYNQGNGLTFGLYNNSSSISLPNAIFNNGGLGIDLLNDGITPNDPLDSDTGPNGLQNYPVLEGVVHSGGSVIVSGTLNSQPNQTYQLWFFTNAQCDPSGYGEGEAFATELVVMTDGNGNAPFTAVFPQQAERPFVTATASPSVFSGTSEFSLCRADPLYLVTLLRAEVQQLVDDGVLAASAGTRLLAKLDNVAAALLAGHENTALLRLQDFIASTRNLMNRRQLPHELGQPLIDAAWAIIHQINLP